MGGESVGCGGPGGCSRCLACLKGTPRGSRPGRRVCRLGLLSHASLCIWRLCACVVWWCFRVGLRCSSFGPHSVPGRRLRVHRFGVDAALGGAGPAKVKNGCAFAGAGPRRTMCRLFVVVGACWHRPAGSLLPVFCVGRGLLRVCNGVCAGRSVGVLMLGGGAFSEFRNQM